MPCIRDAIAAVLLLLAALAPAQAERAPEGATGQTRKPAVHAKRFMAVTAHPEATRAAYDVLAAGGSAADAAVAAQLVLNLVEPQSSGIGGGGFLLYWDAKAQRLFAYDGREAAPAGAKPAMFLGAEGIRVPFLHAVRSGNAVGVPGAMALLGEVHKRHGKQPWATLFAPARTLAQQGFRVTPRLHQLIADTPTLKERKETRAYFFTAAGAPLPAGHVLRNPDFLATLARLAEDGAASFYRGRVADAVAARVREHGGTLSAADLGAYKVEERDPVCGPYLSFRICSMGPPSSGGIAVLQILAILEHFPNETVAAEDEKAAHLFIEATRLAFADRNRYVADPAFVRVPVKGLLDKDYLAGRAKLIDPKKALATVEAGAPPEDKGEFAPDHGEESAGTSHLSIVDAEGNAVSFTTTIENGFGAQMMAGGFLLNNQLTDFSWEPERDGKPVANRIEPGKRPRSSMAPVIVFDDRQRLILVLGSPGGARIIAYVARNITRILDGGTDIAAAFAKPHVATTGAAVELEKGTDVAQLAERLQRLGHRVVVRDLTSGLHGIQINDGVLIGGADPRREGVAMGE